MKIFTLQCSECSTIVAANVLEDTRVMKCPGLDCEEVLRFEQLSEAEQEHVVANRDQYRM
jgi:hypothetical protein